MTSAMASAVAPTRGSRGVEPRFALAALGFLLLVPAFLVALALDPTVLGGENVWLKPVKFAVSLALYTATLAIMARWLPPALTASPVFRIYVLAVVAACAFEIVWIAAGAAAGSGSHFNETTPLWAALFTLAGVLAVFLTTATAVYAVAFARAGAGGPSPPVRLALMLGLGLTFVLTVAIAGTIGSVGRHAGSAAAADGAVIAVLGWSRSVADLRPAHFLATHAMQVVPLAALVAVRLRAPRPRIVVAIVAAGYAALTLTVFAEALAGRPFLSSAGL